jgi:hypothetical protein
MQGRKQFFFEKKNQKTFASLAHALRQRERRNSPGRRLRYQLTGNGAV